MTFNEFKNNVEPWAAERGIYEHSSTEAQLMKALSELGELADAIIKGDDEALKDAVGQNGPTGTCNPTTGKARGFEPHPELVKLANGGVSDGSTANYYQLPEGSEQLQDLISYRNMNGQIAEIFRSCYRYGRASHSDQLRDAKKIAFYAQAEVARLEKYGSED